MSTLLSASSAVQFPSNPIKSIPSIPYTNTYMNSSSSSSSSSSSTSSSSRLNILSPNNLSSTARNINSSNPSSIIPVRAPSKTIVRRRYVPVDTVELSDDDNDESKSISDIGAKRGREEQKSKTSHSVNSIITTDNNNNKRLKTGEDSDSDDHTPKITRNQTWLTIDEIIEQRMKKSQQNNINNNNNNNNENTILPLASSDNKTNTTSNSNSNSTTNNNPEPTGPQCSLCLSPFTQMCTIKCGHVFDYDCIMECLKTSSVCPLCRAKVNKRQIQKIFM